MTVRPRATVIVAVGSENPAKIESVRLAFSRLWPRSEWQVQGCPVASGVSDQPLTDAEARRGARTRAASALAKLDGADYGVGLEGGLEEIEQRWFNCGWAAVVDQAGAEGIGATIRMEVPPVLMRRVLAGSELGYACDEVFQGENTKLAQGYFGLMTDNVLHRTSAFSDAVIAALASFLHPELVRQD
jgi:inosine/xanthosine triphosphatase